MLLQSTKTHTFLVWHITSVPLTFAIQSSNDQHLLFVLGLYQTVIQEYHHKCVQIRSKNYIHKIYECSRGIGESKRHHCKPIMAISNPEGCNYLESPQLQFKQIGSRISFQYFIYVCIYLCNFRLNQQNDLKMNSVMLSNSPIKVLLNT